MHHSKFTIYADYEHLQVKRHSTCPSLCVAIHKPPRPVLSSWSSTVCLWCKRCTSTASCWKKTL